MKINGRVPTVVQWVKNPTEVAEVSAEVWFRSLAQLSGLTDPALAQLRFSPWPGELSHAVGAAITFFKSENALKINFHY